MDQSNLVVYDDPAFRELVVRFLADLSLRVATRRSPKVAPMTTASTPTGGSESKAQL